MTRFANAAHASGGRFEPACLWLAGLLEGEGTFLRPPPSSPRYPMVSCRMTDRDVIERVSLAFGTAVRANYKGAYKTEFAVTLKGLPAVNLMKSLRPIMGVRRQAAIDRALTGYEPPRRKLSLEAAQVIRDGHTKGESVTVLASRHQVARQSIHAILDYRIYRPRQDSGWRSLADGLGDADPAGTVLSKHELYWLAGWLEAEGSFLRPPPSDPGRPRIAAQSCDRDVVEEAGRLLGVASSRSHDSRARARNWSPIWRVMVSGRRAVDLMRTMETIMRVRRRRQIRAALESVVVEAPRIERGSAGTKR